MFLIEHWCSDEIAEVIGQRKMYISFKSCYKYMTQNGKSFRTNFSELDCDAHMEADTKVALTLHKLSGPQNVVVRCADTDILVIVLANMIHFDNELTVWLQFGVGNNCRFINATEISRHLGVQLCASLPAFHALTGCDFTPSFYRKGKQKPFSLLRGNEKYQKAFADLANPSLVASTAPIIEEFVCRLYATTKNRLSKVTSVNEARLRMFEMQYGMIDDMELFKKKIISFDASTLPPCARELDQQVLRAAYISYLWTNAFQNITSEIDPLNYGWCLNEHGQYTFNWFEGPDTPENIQEILLTSAGTYL